MTLPGERCILGTTIPYSTSRVNNLKTKENRSERLPHHRHSLFLLSRNSCHTLQLQYEFQVSNPQIHVYSCSKQTPFTIVYVHVHVHIIHIDKCIEARTLHAMYISINRQLCCYSIINIIISLMIKRCIDLIQIYRVSQMLI